MEPVTASRKLDGCYSWVVCSAVFLIEFIVMGLYTAFGTLFVALITEFNATESSAAWVGSVAFSVCYISSFVVNLLLPRIGYRGVCCLGSILFGVGLVASSFANTISLLFVSYGIVYGVGSGFLHFSGILVIPKYFKFKRGIAYGLALSGHGIGALPVGYMMDLLVTQYGVRITLRICAILALPLFICGLLFGSATVREKCKMEKNCPLERVEKTAPQKVWKNKALMAYSVALWMYGFGYYIPSVHLVNMAEGLGVPLIKATLLPSSIAISQSVGKIVFGQLAMCFRRINTVYYCQVTIFICGLVTTFCPLMSDFYGLLSYTIIYGFFDACSTVFTLKIIEEVLGEGNIDIGYSFQMVGMSFFMLIGPPVAGFLYEVTGSYEIPFFLSGGCATVTVCIMFLVPYFRDRDHEQLKFTEEFARKISILSTSSSASDDSQFSTDSGISLQIEIEKEEGYNNFHLKDHDMEYACSMGSLSSSSDVACFSDYETDSVGIDISCNDLEKDSLQNCFSEKDSLSAFKDKTMSSFWLTSEFEITREQFLVADRETCL